MQKSRQDAGATREKSKTPAGGQRYRKIKATSLEKTKEKTKLEKTKEGRDADAEK
jgi:hypothetical protein